MFHRGVARGRVRPKASSPSLSGVCNWAFRMDPLPSSLPPFLPASKEVCKIHLLQADF